MYRNLLTVVLLAISAVTIGPQLTASAAPVSSGNAALDWAEAHETGDWYVYGADGPDTYDCSGAVSTAFLKAAGISIGRDTYEMLASPHLHRVSLDDVQRGDLLFWGDSHVEFATRWYHVSFGARDWGLRIGWGPYGGEFMPTAAFEVW